MKDLASVTEAGRVSQQMFHFGRSVVWMRDQPGWFVAQTEHDDAGQLVTVNYRQLSPEEVALLQTMYPLYWGYQGRAVLVPPQLRGLRKWFAALLRRPKPADTVVEFWAVFYDPRVYASEAVEEVAQGVNTAGQTV